ncbi:chemotaxis protein CheW [Cupriavidus agavae]|uniref:Chemotaxis-related protein WspB n=1 Tax=Cupriavidus agavae TaxID=1001822 RepID=A0A4Q7RRN8_9BURK|nr:chemotaxis protein CheW [Cupriavidus agavae]RZT36294.1 chemotaxis-related protein WspB [Cupriavidus agavae]
MALFLLFRIGPDYYALDSAEVAEVLPLAATRQVPGAPAWVAGLMVRHGEPVPVIDMTALATGQPAAARTSTRTVMVHYRPNAGDASRLLGLRLEYATDTLRCDPATFVDSGVEAGEARYLGPVRHDARGLIQWVRVDALLPEPVRALLFQGATPA